jgi:hypothetical protein
MRKDKMENNTPLPPVQMETPQRAQRGEKRKKKKRHRHA